jgi:membrane protease YdiL (CAAX protease family)
VDPQYGIKGVCPCCQKELRKLSNYQACPVCRWVFDPIQSQFPTNPNGANRVSLLIARENYRNYGVSDPELFAVDAKTLKNSSSEQSEFKASEKASQSKRLIIYEIIAVELAGLMPGVIAALVYAVQELVGQGSQAVISPFVNHHVGLDVTLQLIVTLLEFYPVVIVGYVMARSGQSLKTLGLTTRVKFSDFSWGVLLMLATFGIEIILSNIIYSLHLASSHDLAASAGLPKIYLLVGVFVSLRTAVQEELIVAAYLLNRLEKLGTSKWLAVIISVLVRLSYHIYGGWTLVLLNIPFGIMQALFYQSKKNVKPLIIGHFLFDALSFAILIK